MAEAWADWWMPRGPRVFGTVNTLYPLSLNQHERVGRTLRRLFYEGCGESPSVLMACQSNPGREGYHSHPLICGSPVLLEARRTDIWQELVRELELQRGAGQQWTPAGGGFDRRPGGSGFYERPVSAEFATNRARPRLEPVRSREDVTGYATRYGVREGDALFVIPGDHWGMEWQLG